MYQCLPITSEGFSVSLAGIRFNSFTTGPATLRVFPAVPNHATVQISLKSTDV